MLEFNDSLVGAEAGLLVRADVHGVVSTLKINEELLTPSDGAVPLHIPKHLFHSFLLFIVVRQHYFAQVLGNIIEIEWVDEVRAIELTGAAGEFGKNYGGPTKLIFVVFGVNELKWTKSEAISQ